MEKQSLIRELTEARIFYNADTLKGKSAEMIAELAFTMILALEMMRHLDASFALKYADKTYKYQDFEKMYNGATDLYNLLVVLGNQSDFADHIIANPNISFPKLQFKRYLRDIMARRVDNVADRTFLYKLEGCFKINDSFLKTVRRAIVDWGDLDADEKKHLKSLLDNKFKKLAQYVDINMTFNSTVIG